jgi:hypothetical protein
MSSFTWTPDALWSERRALAGVCWRLVEAQHKVSTLKLVDSLDEQAMLENLIEATKPPVPPECRHLHYLLATPFRYGSPYPTGSRFRRAGLTPGVFYAAEQPQTAVAELAFHRLLFFAESPATPWPTNPAEYTSFCVDYATASGLDLTSAPLVRDRARWTHPTDYARCQDLADAARTVTIDVIRYESVRDPQRRAALALLSCQAFVSAAPTARQTWRMRVGLHGVQTICEFPDIRLEFDRAAFAADPRVAAMVWER